MQRIDAANQPHLFQSSHAESAVQLTCEYNDTLLIVDRGSPFIDYSWNDDSNTNEDG